MFSIKKDMKFVRPINTGGNSPSVSTPFNKLSHPGTDYAYPEGTKVYASEDGEVIMAKGNETRKWIANSPSDPFRITGKTRSLKTEDYGNYIKLQHANSYSSLYAHLKYDSLYVKAGEKVKKGQLIAEVGSTGNSTGNHMHWEVRFNDQTFDPSTMFDDNFTGYADKTPAAQVAVDADVFPTLVFRSSQYDKVVAEYKPDADSKSTPFEDVRNVINGKLSRVTVLENENAELQVQYAASQAEVNNRIEQTGRLKDELLQSGLREEGLLRKLEEAAKNSGGAEGVYKKQLETKQTELNNMAKAKGLIEIEVAQWKTKYEQAVKGIKQPSAYDAIFSIVEKLIPFLKKTSV